MKWRVLGLGALAAVSGCAQVLGLGDFEDAEGTGGSGGAGATSTSSQGGGATTSTTSSTGQGGGGAGQGGSGGQGGDGGQGGAPVCAQGDTIPCYTGDPSLPGKGACAEGTATCLPDGTGYGDCEGEVLPVAEDCATPTDENCDDQVNEGCACAPGTMAVCYSGAAGTENNAPCKAGFMTCNPDGLGYGPCLGEVTPQAEVCEAQLIDEDCDGNANDGCTCIPGTTAPCYTGPVGTGNVGQCQTGTYSCLPDGSGYGACLGEITPKPEVCEAGQKDENCDGTANEGCICAPNSSTACYTGPAGTQGVGICSPGMKTCAGDGLSYGACMGEVVPAAETCGAVADEDCSGADCVVWGKGLPTGLKAMDTDSQGNVYAVAYATGTQNFGGGNLIGAGGQDVFVVKYDALGNYVWALRWGDAQDQYAHAIDVTPGGEVAVGGEFKGTIDFGGGITATAVGTGSNGYIAKLTTNGTVVWAKTHGAANNTHVTRGVSFTPQGDVAVTGSFAGTINLGGGTLTSAGLNDIFVAKLKGADGAQLWANRYGDAAAQNGTVVTVDPAGNVFVGVYYAGTVTFGALASTTASAFDLLYVRLDPNGTPSCRAGFTTSDSDFFTRFSADSAGALVMSGSFYGTMSLGGANLASGGSAFGDVFLAKHSSACAHVWSTKYGVANSSEYASDSHVDAQDNVYLTMNAGGSIDMGGGLLAGSGSIDVVVAKYNNAGAYQWSRLFGNANAQDVPVLASSSSGVNIAFSNNGSITIGGNNYSSAAILTHLAP